MKKINEIIKKYRGNLPDNHSRNPYNWKMIEDDMKNDLIELIKDFSKFISENCNLPQFEINGVLNSYLNQDNMETYVKNIIKKKKSDNEKLVKFYELDLNNDELENMIRERAEYNKNDNTYYPIDDNDEFCHFLYDYAEKYGMAILDEDYTKYANEFTVNIYSIKGFYIHKMIGQGVIIHIHKIIF